MEALKALLGQVDDDYLTGLSNKGTVKRAYKDLEKEAPEVIWQEGSAQVALKEETCVIRAPLGESTCTCPSRSMCRHIVTAVLWLKRETAGEASLEGQVVEGGKGESSEVQAVEGGKGESSEVQAVEEGKPESTEGQAAEEGKPGFQEGRTAEEGKPGFQEGRTAEGGKPGFQEGRTAEGETPGSWEGRIAEGETPGSQEGRTAKGGKPGFQEGQISKKGKQPSLVSRDAGNGNTETEKQNRKPGEKKELLAVPLEKLKKACGSRNLKRFLAHVQTGEVPDLEETSIVTVKLPWDRETVKLLEPLEYSTCTCHSRELCAHKAQALLYYQIKRGVLTLKDLENAGEESSAFDREEVSRAALSVCEALALQLRTGLSRQSEEVMESLERLAVISHRALLASLESGLREMAGEYKEYFERSAAFREEELLRKLLAVYRLAQGIAKAESPEELKSLAGKFRDTYEPVGTLRLMGLGVRSFSSKAGYEGEIYYFLETKKQEFYTWTDARPMFYEGVYRRRPASVENAPAPWGLSCNREQMTDLAFELREARAASGGRLSASRETKGEITGVKSLCDEAVAPLIFWDYEKMLTEYYWAGAKGQGKMGNAAFSEGGRRERLALAGAVRWGETSFDEVEQRFSWTLYDEKDRKLFVSLKYTKEEKLTIALLERLEQRLRKRAYASIVFFGALYLEEGRLCMYPVEFFLQEERAQDSGIKKTSETDPQIREKKDFRESAPHSGGTDQAGEADGPVPDREILQTMGQYVGEARRHLADVFVTGLDSVPDEMAKRLSACGEEGESLGLHQAGKELGIIGGLLGEKRHQMQFSPEPVIEAMGRLDRYLAACRRKLFSDQALGEMMGEE